MEIYLLNVTRMGRCLGGLKPTVGVPIPL
jgi:hypothetical protein